MKFEEVLPGLREGKMYARKSWDKKGKFIYIIPAFINVDPKGVEHRSKEQIAFKTFDDTIELGVQPSAAGILADDWYEVK